MKTKLSPHRPGELVMTVVEDSFYTLGLDFDPAAPYSGCRICGALYQSNLDRESYANHQAGLFAISTDPISGEEYFIGDEDAVRLYIKANDRRERWRYLHTRRYHTEREINTLRSSGFAFMPEAAHKLSPFGIIPLGNMHRDIADAMFEAPRAPVEDAEK